MFNPKSTPPSKLFIEITSECNLRCKHCHLWMSKEGDGTLSTAEKERVLREFAAMNPKGQVVFSGGEPLRKPDEFFHLCGVARELGILCVTVTNGSLLLDDGAIRKMLLEGPDHVVLSLDSPRREVHDFIRGVPGTYDKAVWALSRLVSMRTELGLMGRRKFLANCVVFERNIADMENLIDFTKDMGADGILFQMLGRTFWNQAKRDAFFENHSVRDKALGRLILADMADKFADDPYVITTGGDFDWMSRYMDNPDFTGQNVCASHHRNLIVNMWGDVQLCFNMDSLVPAKTFPNIRETRLAELWSSPAAGGIREVMDGCRKNCGMLNCHRKREAVAKPTLLAMAEAT